MCNSVVYQMSQKVQNAKLVSACVCVSLYVCGAPNVKLVSLACMLNDPKSVKCKDGICIWVHVSVYIYISVCVVCVPFINLLSLACMQNKPKSAKFIFTKIRNF